VQAKKEQFYLEGKAVEPEQQEHQRAHWGGYFCPQFEKTAFVCFSLIVQSMTVPNRWIEDKKDVQCSLEVRQ